VIAQVEQRAENIGRMRALGFCVSVEHARFMARVFGEAGLSAVAVWADSSPEEPADALGTLRDGGLRVVFSVDLFNEGVDVPVVDTLLLLRPTDSPTLFLQQLGRGLRRAENKNVCTVLDFVGHHRKEFRLDRRFRALLGGTRKQLERQIAEGFPFLPAGCHMELDRVAEEIVLRNIRESLPSRWEGKVEELRSLAATSGAEVSLARFLDETGFELEEVYAAGRSWSDLMESAGLAVAPAGPQEKQLRRACGRMLHVDDSYVGRRSRTSSPATDRSSLTSARERLTSTMIAQTLDSRPFIQLVWPERKHGGSIRRAYRRSRPRPPDRRLPIGGLLCHPRPG
jgi:superfamily II DNA/RNA helicase